MKPTAAGGATAVVAGTGTHPPKPMLRRIVDFPLVALVAAMLLLDFGMQVAARINGSLGWPDSSIRGVTTALIMLLIIYKLLVRHLGESPRDDLPFSLVAAGQLGAGMTLGFVLFSLIVGVAATLDVYNIVDWGSWKQFVPAFIGIAMVPAITEELLFRGILFRWIEEIGGSWVALLVTAALFGAEHITNAHGSSLASFGIAIEAGVLLGGAYMVTRSLWCPIGLHAAWNFTQGFIFGVPVSGLHLDGLVRAELSGPELLSGGLFGLEASLIAMVIGSAAGVWLVFLAVRRGELMRPWWRRARPHPA